MKRRQRNRWGSASRQACRNFSQSRPAREPTLDETVDDDFYFIKTDAEFSDQFAEPDRVADRRYRHVRDNKDFVRLFEGFDAAIVDMH